MKIRGNPYFMKNPKFLPAKPFSASALNRLKLAAYSAQKNAYAPYSGYFIGSSLEDAAGKVYSGCNIENSSYGGTVCAERVAIWKGVSEGMKLPIKTLVVVSSSKDKWPPCGFCRQVMAEFCDPKTIIYFGNKHKEFKKITFAKLFPEAFGKNFL